MTDMDMTKTSIHSIAIDSSLSLLAWMLYWLFVHICLYVFDLNHHSWYGQVMILSCFSLAVKVHLFFLFMFNLLGLNLLDFKPEVVATIESHASSMVRVEVGCHTLWLVQIERPPSKVLSLHQWWARYVSAKCPWLGRNYQEVTFCPILFTTFMDHGV